MTESKRENKNGNKRENKTEDRAGFGGPLYRKLREYGESDYYGFHMPGRRSTASTICTIRRRTAS